MTSTNAGATRTCPACNARNTNLSLFCAECGASLNGAADSDTAEYAPLNDRDDAQETAVFEPASRAYDPVESTRPKASDPSATSTQADALPSYWETPTASASDRVWTPVHEESSSPGHGQAPQGVRGFVLGSIAFLLVLAVFLLWTWASLLDQGTRESIQDFFGFIG